MNVEYLNDKKIAYFNGIRFTRDNKTGYYLCAQSIDGKRPRLHVYVWSHSNGIVPPGHHVHHKDGDKNKNDINDLVLMTSGEHMSLHSKERFEENPEQIRGYLDIARIEASKWHKSKEGREFAAKNFDVSLRPAMAIEIDMTCDVCGSGYKTNKTKRESSRFCSNSCKSKWRRAAGLDDISKPCVICGDSYTSNKYNKSVTCSPTCRGKLKTLRHSNN